MLQMNQFQARNNAFPDYYKWLQMNPMVRNPS